MAMQLFRIDHHNENGEDLGLYVTAASPLDAAKLWFPWYLQMEGINDLDAIHPDRQCEVQAVPQAGRRARIHDWGEIGHCGFFVLRDLITLCVKTD